MNHQKSSRLITAFLIIAGSIFARKAAGSPGIQLPLAFVLDKSQYPSAIKKSDPSHVYVDYEKLPASLLANKTAFKGDTIIDLRKFIDSAKDGLKAYRLIFESSGRIDSVWQLDNKFRLTDKGWSMDNNLMRIYAYDSTSRLTDKFIYNYAEKIQNTAGVTTLNGLLRLKTFYSAYDRSNYATNAVWVLSVGINQYKGIRSAGVNCESDAVSYNGFFKTQFSKMAGAGSIPVLYNEYLLLGNEATKAAIIDALKDIAAKASANDCFIFNYSGFSNILTLDSDVKSTYFFPYDENGYTKEWAENGTIKNQQAGAINQQLISLNILQEYIQQIPAVNQLFISEAGPSEKFKTEFIRMLMQNSPAVASLLNKNRVIIVPNKIGMDNISCKGDNKEKGPINYFITSLDPSVNIFNLFKEGDAANRVAYEIKMNEYACNAYYNNYFEIFFEKQFLQEYNDVFGSSDNPARGLKTKSKELQQTISQLTGEHYALVVGTDNYKGKGWSKLSNPVKDAKAVAEELTNSYGFKVRLLEDKPMDTIYNAIREYYRLAKPNDQFVVYFAGHGDVDDELLDDGFIVCNDSKSVEDDPIRNTYISYTKLKKILNNIPARQVLVLLDVCHGGTFDAKAFDDEKREGEYNNISNRNVLQFLKDKLPLQTRKFLSSVGSEPAFDGKAGRHSPFANLLLQVLRAKGSGSNGIVTLSDINAVLQTASLNETEVLKISPHMADFGKVDAFTEFIFIPMENTPANQ